MLQYVTLSIFGGRSLATSALVRRRMNGFTRERRYSRLSPSPSRMGLTTPRWNACCEPGNPGIRTSNRDHSSNRLFSMGVPDRHSRIRALMERTERAVMVFGFLMFCASSRMIELK